jgi:hypothetical protein
MRRSIYAAGKKFLYGSIIPEKIIPPIKALF